MMNFMYDGDFTDATVTIPVKTTYKEGLVLGVVTASKKLAPYKSTAEDGSENPCYTLAQDITNISDSETEVNNVRVFATGTVNAQALYCLEEDDSVADIITPLKNNGILALNAQEDIQGE